MSLYFSGHDPILKHSKSVTEYLDVPSSGDPHDPTSHHDVLEHYDCNECPEQFVYLRDLTAHLMMHAMLKPFGCGRCLQPFAEADETIQHFYDNCPMIVV